MEEILKSLLDCIRLEDLSLQESESSSWTYFIQIVGDLVQRIDARNTQYFRKIGKGKIEVDMFTRFAHYAVIRYVIQ